MRLTGKLIAAACAGLMLSGCGALNSLTGQTDNTVLPGQREDAIPGRSKFPENKDVAAGSSAGTSTSAATDETYCAPDDPACKPPGTSGDTFSDPQ
jgi:hypothetical protein